LCSSGHAFEARADCDTSADKGSTSAVVTYWMTATVRRGAGTNSRLSPVNFSLVSIAAVLFRFSAKALADPIDRTAVPTHMLGTFFVDFTDNITRVWDNSFVCYTTHRSTSRLRWVYRRGFEGDLLDSGDHYSPADSNRCAGMWTDVARAVTYRHRASATNTKGVHFCYFGVITTAPNVERVRSMLRSRKPACRAWA
jgi:hypothetical protein